MKMRRLAKKTVPFRMLVVRRKLNVRPKRGELNVLKVELQPDRPPSSFLPSFLHPMTSALVQKCAQQLGLSLGINGGPGPALTSDEEDRRGLPQLVRPLTSFFPSLILVQVPEIFAISSPPSLTSTIHAPKLTKTPSSFVLAFSPFPGLPKSTLTERLCPSSAQTELTASYLPSLIRTLTENTFPSDPRPDNQSETSWWGLIYLCFHSVTDAPSFLDGSGRILNERFNSTFPSQGFSPLYLLGCST